MVVALVVGAGLGLLARRRFAIAAGVFVAFGVVGFVASLDDPLANPGVAGACAAVSIGLGLWVLGTLLDRSGATAPVPAADGTGAAGPGGADARLVAPGVPHAGRGDRRRRRRGRIPRPDACWREVVSRRSAAGRPSRRRR